MSTITLTNQQHQQTTAFQYGNCGTSQVYLSGLQEGESILFETPFLIQNTNGIIAGIDQRFTFLKHIKDKTVIDTMELSWSDSCQTKTGSIFIDTKAIKSPPASFGIEWVLVAVSLFFAVLVVKIRQ